MQLLIIYQKKKKKQKLKGKPKIKIYLKQKPERVVLHNENREDVSGNSTQHNKALLTPTVKLSTMKRGTTRISHAFMVCCVFLYFLIIP